jgi:hypothetical protein
MIFKAGGKSVAALAFILIVMQGMLLTPVAAEICDDEEKPPLALLGDSLVLPDVDWDIGAFYPEGCYLDSLGTQFYDLESQFTFYGLVADFDITEENPPHHYLPFGWRDLKMATIRWNKPGSGTLIRVPEVGATAVWVDDPAPGGDSVLISAKPIIYGSYEGSRDQVFRFEYRVGAGFMGESVPSSVDSTYLAWDINEWSLDWDPEGVLLALDIGDTTDIVMEVAWSEAWGPDEEFGFAPGDELRSGVIDLYSRYTRLENGDIELLDTNIDCVHEMTYGLSVSFTHGLIPVGYIYEFVAEDFEGYHIWRRVNGAENWSSIWELGKNEEQDKFYWWWIEYEKDPVTLEIIYEWETLTPIFSQTDKRVFLDFDVHNGFHYDYAITTFDRGFRPQGGGHDHVIIDSTPYDDLNSVASNFNFNYPAAANLDRTPAVYAVPNPLRTGKSALEDPNYHNFPGKVVRFVGLTDDSILRVYNLAGDLIFTAENQDPDTRNIVWDTKNQKGEDVASGVYIFHSLDSKTGDDAYGRLVIIR